MSTDAHHARRRRLWRQVCDSLWTSVVHTSRYVARHKPGRVGYRWDWESRCIAAFYAVAIPLAGTCLVGFIKVRSGT